LQLGCYGKKHCLFRVHLVVFPSIIFVAVQFY
jgi:hypothetical protein